MTHVDREEVERNASREAESHQRAAVRGHHCRQILHKQNTHYCVACVCDRRTFILNEKS